MAEEKKQKETDDLQDKKIEEKPVVKPALEAKREKVEVKEEMQAKLPESKSEKKNEIASEKAHGSKEEKHDKKNPESSDEVDDLENMGFVEITDLQRSIDQLVKAQRSANSLGMNFLRGILSGFGVFVGSAVLVALFIYIISLFDTAPVIGGYANKILDIIKNTKK
jgi:hypothetical protein